MKLIGRGRYASETYPQSPAAAGGGGGGTGIDTVVLYNPVTPSVGNSVQTWPEVMAKVAASQAPISILAKGAVTIPAGGPYDMNYAVLGSIEFASPNSGRFDLLDGAQLHNLGGLRSTKLRCFNTTDYALTFSGDPLVLFFQFFKLQDAFLEANASHNVWHIADGLNGLLRLELGSITGHFDAGTGAIVELGNGSSLTIECTNNYLASGQAVVDGSFVGPASSSIDVLTDGSFGNPVNVGFTGTMTKTIDNFPQWSTATRPTQPDAFGPSVTACGLNTDTGVIEYTTDGVHFFNALGAPT